MKFKNCDILKVAKLYLCDHDIHCDSQITEINTSIVDLSFKKRMFAIYILQWPIFFIHFTIYFRNRQR